MEKETLFPSQAHTLHVPETLYGGGGGGEGEREQIILSCCHSTHQGLPPAPALQLAPLSLPPQLIILADYLTASPTVTCLALTDSAIWATWPGAPAP